MRGYIETLGIILSIYPLRENDRRIYMLTSTHGKIAATAKGARNLKSPFIGKLQPLNLCKLILYKSSESTFTITECELRKGFEEIKKDLSKSTHALELIESTKFLEQTNEKHEIFELFFDTLHKFESSRKNNLILQSFRIKFLDLMGLLPSLTHCQKCHKKIEFDSEKSWDPHFLACQNCALSTHGDKNYHDRFRKLVQFLKKNTFPDIHKIQMTENEEKILEEIAEKLWNESGNFTLRTARIRQHLLA